jgi:3-oxoacyl-[acyl-carrier protein] reductase
MSEQDLTGELAGKVAIVTGGGGGMGRVMALALAERGARVAVLDIRRAEAEAVANEGGRIADSEAVLPLVVDVTQGADCAAAVQQTIDAFNGLHILVNAAGIGMQTLRDDYWKDPVRFWQCDPDAWQRLMDVNWRGAFLMSRAVAPHMIAQKWGRIINLTTSLDTMCFPGYTPYGPSKAALEAATSGWAKDLMDTGVTANVLVPGGPVNTGFIPTGAPFARDQLIQPEVMAAPLCWLASDASDGVTDRRFVARDWDPGVPVEAAVEAAGGPAAWPNAGKKAYRAGAAPPV